ncbi:MAG: TolC family protein [Gammaproteobacteria bacterium]|nr:TolC family protein [Gammaproteobacteria bacterium]
MSITKAAACACGWLLLSLPLPAAWADSAPFTAYGDHRLAALIAEALDRNPSIHEALLDSQAAHHRIPQATALPDPTLSFTWHAEPPQTRVGPQRAGVSVSQRIPWFGKRADRGAVARKLAEAHDETAALRRAEVVRQVKFAYYDLAYLDSAVRITQREEDVLRLYESLAQSRYAQGVGLQQAVVRLQAEITRVLSRLDKFLQQRAEIEAALNGLRDRPEHEPVAEARLESLPTVDIDEQRLHQLGRAQRPEVRAARLRIASEEDNVRLARRKYWPDLTLAAAWGAIGQRRDEAGRLAPPRDNGKDTASFTVGITVPLRQSQYRAAEREAAARLQAAKAAYRRTVNEVDTQVRAAGVRLAMIGERIALFERALLPQAEQALHSTESAYSAGRIGVLDLLDSEEALLDARLELARLKSDYMQALADMERAIGSAFPEEWS